MCGWHAMYPTSALAHTPGLCAMHKAPSQTPWKLYGPGSQHGRLKPALTFEKGMCVGTHLPTISEVLQVKLGSLLGSFTYNHEGASKEVLSSTKCSETFWGKGLMSVVLNLSLISPQ